MIYVAITFIALAFLNLYCSASCQRLFFESKESAMIDKVHLASTELEKLDVLTPSNVTASISSIG